jgi:long-chain acyl-CoA synthetase
VRSRRTTKHDLSSVRTCVSGAMRLPPETVKKFEQVAGGRLVEGYGLTESSPVALANPLNDNARPGSIGVPVPGTDVRIVSVDDPARELPVGEAGELCIRGPQVFAGYWNQPDETGVMLRDGWLHTGDVAIMDSDGFVTLVDRKRDVILASGFSIFPSEIEDVLGEHPAVAECAIVGVPHSYRGETVKAYVVRHEGATASEDELRAYCAYRLVAYKVPTLFEFRDELPKNMLGKVLRRVLRAEHEAAFARVTSPDFEPDVERDLEPDAEPDVVETTVPPALVTDEAAAPADLPGDPAPVAAVAEHDDLVGALERLAHLHSAGELTDEEYHAAKSRLLQS